MTPDARRALQLARARAASALEPAVQVPFADTLVNFRVPMADIVDHEPFLLTRRLAALGGEPPPTLS